MHVCGRQLGVETDHERSGRLARDCCCTVMQAQRHTMLNSSRARCSLTVLQRGRGSVNRPEFGRALLGGGQLFTQGQPQH